MIEFQKTKTPPMPNCKPPRKTPNCATCKWITIELNNTGQIPINYNCLAMGGQDAVMCWNTDECKQLYEVSE